MHGVLTEKLKPCNMHMQIFHFTVRYAYLREGKRVFSFDSKPKIFPKNNLEHKIKEKQHFPNSFLFSKSNQKGESLFLKEKQFFPQLNISSIEFLQLSFRNCGLWVVGMWFLVFPKTSFHNHAAIMVLSKIRLWISDCGSTFPLFPKLVFYNFPFASLFP